MVLRQGLLLLIVFVSIFTPFNGTAGPEPSPKLVWIGITNRIAADEPWPVTIEAQDGSGTRVSNYFATASLSVFQKTNLPPALVVSEITVFPKRIEISNPTTNQVNIDGWRLTILDRQSATSWVNVSFTNVIVPPKGVFTAEESSVPRSSAYPFFYWTGRADWSLSSPFGAMIRNDAGEIIDLVFSTGIQTSALGDGAMPDQWRGSGLNSFGGRVRRTGSRDRNAPDDFSSSGFSNMGQYNVDLAYPLQTWVRPESVTPQEIQVTNGSWSGEIVVPWATYVVLTAQDTNGASGRTAVFHSLPNPPLTLILPSTALEGTQTLTGRVHLSNVAQTDTTVLLETGTAILQIDASVTIPAGGTNAEFSINVVDDELLNGSREAVITARAHSFYRADATIRVDDDESTALFLSMPAQISEGQTNIGTVTALRVPDVDIFVRLATVPSGLISVPTNVVLRAGETNALVVVAAPDDDFLDTNTMITITASVASWTNAAADVMRFDTDSRVLVLEVPPVLWEGAGVRSNAGAIRLNGRVREDTEFLLEAGSSLIGVPGTVTIAARGSNANFNITVGDDQTANGRIPVEVRAQQGGFGLVRQNISVEDNDPVEIHFSPIKSPQFVEHGFQVSFTAINFDGVLLTNPIPGISLTAGTDSGELPASFTTLTQATGGLHRTVATISTNTVAAVIQASATGRTNIWQSDPFNVFSLSVTNLAFGTLDLAWDSTRQLLYATVPEQSTNYGTHLVAVNPVNGEIVKTLPIGPMRFFETSTSFQDGRMALSDDQSTLYVAYDYGQSVKRIDLNAWSSNLSFVITNEFISQMAVADMCVVPGDASLLAVLETRVSSTSPWQLALYHNGVRVAGGTRDFISNVAPGFVPGEVFGFGGSFFENSSRLITYSAEVSSLTTVANTNSTALGYSNYIKTSGGSLFGNRGIVFDPLARVLGFFDVLPTVVDPDVANRRAYFLGYTNLMVFDTGTFLQTADLPLPTWSGRVMEMKSLGNRVALGTTDSLLLVSSELMGRTMTTTDLAVDVIKPSTNAVVGQPYSYSVTVTNSSTNLAPDVRLVVSAATNRLAFPGTTSNGNGGRVSYPVNLGNLPAGAQTNLVITVTPIGGGAVPLTFVVASGAPETSHENNHSEVFMSVAMTPLPPDGHARSTLNVAELAYSAQAGRLYLSLKDNREFPGGAVAIVEPATLGIDQLLFAGEAPEKLSVSSDGKYLHVILKSGTEIARADLQSSNSAPLRFSPAAPNLRFRSLAALPGSEGSVAVASATTNQFNATWEVALYDDGVARPLVGPPNFGFGKDVLLFSDAGTLLHTFDAEGRMWERYSVANEGLAFLGSGFAGSGIRLAPFSAALRNPHIFLPSGSILHTGGEIIGQLQGDFVHDPFHDSQVLYDAAADLVVVTHNLGENIELLFYDPTTRSRLMEVNLPWLSDRVNSFVQWSEDGFAFVEDTGELHVMRSSVLPTAGPAETSLELRVEDQVDAGDVFTIELSVTNRSNFPVENARVTLAVPPELSYVSVNPLGMPIQKIDDSLLINAGQLAPLSERKVYLAVRCWTVGKFEIAARLYSTAKETNLADNVARIDFETVIEPQTFTQFNLKVGEKSRWRVHHGRDEIWAIQNETNIISIDLITGGIQTNATLSSAASLLEITPSGRYVYVGGYFGELVRYDLESNLQALTIPVSRLNAFVPLAENETSVLVSHSTESFASTLQIWDEATVRSNIVYSSPVYGFAAAAPGTIYGAGVAPLWEITYDGSGVSEVIDRIPEHRSLTRELQIIGDLIYSSVGEILDPSTNAIIREISPEGFVIGYADPASGRYFGATRIQNQFTVTAYDITSFETRDLVTFPNVAGHPKQIARWGENGLVFSTSAGELWVVRSTVVPYEAPDEDGDDMPDVWENLHGLSSEVANAAADPDGDGATNASEYRAGTHPTDATSCLALRIAANSESGSSALSVQTVAGRRYQLEASDTILTGWIPDSDPFYGSSAPLVLEIATENSSNRFYRLREVP